MDLATSDRVSSILRDDRPGSSAALEHAAHSRIPLYDGLHTVHTTSRFSKNRPLPATESATDKGSGYWRVIVFSCSGAITAW